MCVHVCVRVFPQADCCQITCNDLMTEKGIQCPADQEQRDTDDAHQWNGMEVSSNDQILEQCCQYSCASVNPTCPAEKPEINPSTDECEARRRRPFV